MIPLKLTRREQNILADLCELLARLDHRFVTEGYRPESITECGEEVAVILDKHEVKPQELGQLYDKFHRTGANS